MSRGDNAMGERERRGDGEEEGRAAVPRVFSFSRRKCAKALNLGVKKSEEATHERREGEEGGG